jgi:hypothetical protein
MSIQITGIFGGINIKKAQGWVKVAGESLENNPIKPLITIFIEKRIIAKGWATESRPDIKSADGLVFGFSLNLTGDLAELKKISDFQVIAEYKGEKKNLNIPQPVALALQYSLLNPAQQHIFKKITDFKQTSSFQIQPANVLAASARTQPPTRKLCVITYANDSSAWFPYFYNYYSSIVGDSAIYVVTPKATAFDTYKLGGIISCSDMKYDDQTRSELISGLATGLQAYYQWTLVCDVDEIVIPHPKSNATFFELLEKETNDAIISRGFNIVQMPDEADFSFDKPILTQRRFAIPSTALSKPHFAKKPIQYCQGYHYCNYKLDFSPANDGFLTLHLKSACHRIREQISAVVSETSYSDEKTSEYTNKSVSDKTFDSRLTYCSDKPIEDINSSAMQEFEKNYAKNLVFITHLGIWRGKHIAAPFLVKLSSHSAHLK